MPCGVPGVQCMRFLAMYACRPIGALNLHGGGEGVVQGVDGVGFVPPDQQVVGVQGVQENVLDLV